MRIGAALAVLMLVTAAPVAGQSVPVADVPAANLAPADPARLAVARRIAAKLLPDGGYRTMMRGVMDQTVDTMLDQMTKLPLGKMLATMGVPAEQAGKIKMENIKRVAEMMDPAFEQRTQLAMHAMIDGMIDVISRFEPDMREAMAEAYAHRFTEAQLTELLRFFETPTGDLYASQLMTLASDPALKKVVQSLTPALYQALPDMLERAQAATAALPKPRDPKTLTKAERIEIAQLLGLDTKDVQ